MTTGYTEFVEIVSGVREGCILSSFLFITVIDFNMWKATKQPGFGRGRKNDKWLRLTDLDFAEYIVAVIEEDGVCQEFSSLAYISPKRKQRSSRHQTPSRST